MTKTGVLEAVSYSSKRVKFNNNWFAVEPFMNLDELVKDTEYEAEFVLTRNGWYIDSFRKKVSG